MKATHKVHKQMVGLKEIQLFPGQFIFGRKQAALDIGVTERNIRTNVHFLEKSGNLTIKTTNKFSIISIVNWHIYQTEENKTTSEVTHKRPASDQQVTTNKNEKNVKNKKLFVADSIELRLAEYFFKHIVRNNPSAKKPDLQSWANIIDLMIRADHRDPEQIKQVVQFCQKDTFWMANILSAKKLREKYDQLLLKMNSSGMQVTPSLPGNGMKEFIAGDMSWFQDLKD